jgi:hypothetical protein
MSDLDAYRRRLLAESRTKIEKYRIGEDLVVHCGCRFCPWQENWMLSGVGLIQECDMSQRLAELSLVHWAIHTESARLDAEKKLEQLVALLALRPKANRVRR